MRTLEQIHADLIAFYDGEDPAECGDLAAYQARHAALWRELAHVACRTVDAPEWAVFAVAVLAHRVEREATR